MGLTLRFGLEGSKQGHASEICSDSVHRGIPALGHENGLRFWGSRFGSRA